MEAGLQRRTRAALTNIIDAVTLPVGVATTQGEACSPGTHHRIGECTIPFPLEVARPDGPVSQGIALKDAEGRPGGPDAAKEFETMVVSFMLKDVVKHDLKNVMGEGAGGDFYLSVFTDAMARKIVEAGGIGIQQHIGPKADD